MELSPSLPVLVIGASGVDLVGRLTAELSPHSSSPAEIRSSFGGVARNIAENLARLGQPVRLLSVVGADSTGDHLLEQVAAAGVDVSPVLRSTEYATSSYLAVLNSQGELEFALDDMRAVSEITPAYVRQSAELIRDSSFIFVDANLHPQTLRAIFSLARQAQRPVGADPTSNRLAPRLQPYLDGMYMLVPNGAEAAILGQHDFNPDEPAEVVEAAKRLVALGVEISIVTLPEFGVCYASSQASGHIPAIRTPVVDPTGAGDALTAAVIFALLNDIPLDDAMRLGVSAASLTLRHPGAVLAELSLEKLYDEFI